MGWLAVGTPLAWPEAKQNADRVREWGIEQLLAIWRRAKGKERDALLWGDEIEYLVVAYDDEHRRVDLSLRQADILDALARDEALADRGTCVPELSTGEPSTPVRVHRERDCAHWDASAPAPPRQHDLLPTFHPEFGRFMLEATPGRPWGIGFRDLLDVERNMRLRRVIAKDHMAPNEYPVTLTTFPRLGAPGRFTAPFFAPSGERLRSQFVPDEICNPHIRFPTLAANIRARRGRKVALNVPVFRDAHTPRPFRDPTVDYDLHRYPEDDDVRNGAVAEDCIYMDAMAFGMGSCCLQITFQAKNITEGRRLYDQLSPLGPVMLALTAATPLYKGFVADTDVRWNQIGAAVDDRTPEELGEKVSSPCAGPTALTGQPLEHDRWRIPKSRYASNSTYISQDPRLRREYLDPDLVVDDALRRRLVDGGMDELLATHFAHLFIRDPIVVFSEELRELDLAKTNHFENLQSTNWQHMRFKPPPHDGDTGWRVEFRPMEIQMTDFENAAFALFIVLVTRAILTFDLNLYVPIRCTTENMETAHARDAVLDRRFHFRKNPFPARHARPASNGASGASTPRGPLPSRPPTPEGPVEDEHEPMTVDEIINGQGESGFPGLLPLVESYLSSVKVDVETRCELTRYLDLIRRRASGRLWTGARWIRHFVGGHAEYRRDSVVTEGMTYDLVKAVERITKGEGVEEGLGREMLGDKR
ncbi:MAG: Zn finger-containing GTPase- Activating Protein for ARF [Thelocarpon impressellum]|nr:MAG: Zn finger-containing GTPase- Activating Protein for ARF [Thelocarpon impressellum]